MDEIKELKFKLKDFFEMDDMLALRIITFLTSVHDLKTVWHLYDKIIIRQPDNYKNHYQLYLLGLNCMHLFGAIEALEKSLKLDTFIELINKTSEETISKLNKLKNLFYNEKMELNGFSKDILKVSRNRFVHSVKKGKIDQFKEKLENSDEEFSVFLGKSFETLNLQFIDEIKLGLMLPDSVNLGGSEFFEYISSFVEKIRDGSKLFFYVANGFLPVLYKEKLQSISTIN